MNLTARLTLPAALLCAQVLTASAHAATVSFGSGPNQFNMEFVPIGSPSNAADTTGNPSPTGAVSYSFHMGKFEVSEDMINKANALGSLAITKDTRGTNKPATSISWNEAARFVNWLNTSQGFSPAYKFAAQPTDGGYSVNANIQLWTISDPGYNAANSFRNDNANYFLPSVDEWYKAAYYDPTNGNYFDYPTGSNSPPTPVANGTAMGTAVYDFQAGPADVMQAGGLSPFGIMGLGGNVYEWEETEFDLVNDAISNPRGVRGGRWDYNSTELASSDRGGAATMVENFNFGFRVVSVTPVPEPSTYALVLTGLTVLGWYQWRHRGK